MLPRKHWQMLLIILVLVNGSIALAKYTNFMSIVHQYPFLGVLYVVVGIFCAFIAWYVLDTSSRK